MTTDSYVVFDTDFGDFVVELYNQAAPLTVANFLTYVNGPAGGESYAGSFFSRLVPGFVLQGGGYAVQNGSVITIPTGAPVQNEYSPSNPNVAGTIAMAKVSGDPNSATDQFFFNLADNSSNLDSQNGGFTVFGQVVENWSVVLALGNLQVYSGLSSPFDALPVEGTVPATGPALDNVVGFSVAVTQPIANGQANQPVLDDQTIAPFATVTLTDPGNTTGAGDGMTITIRNAAGTPTAALGTLSLAATTGGPTLTATATGTYTLSTAASIGALQSALRQIVFTPATQTSTATATFDLTLNTPGGNIDNQDTSVVITHDTPGLQLVDAYYQALLRGPPDPTTAQSLAAQLSAGTQTSAGLLAQLLTTAQATTIPGLLSYAFMYGKTPASSGLSYLATYAADLQSGNYTFTGGFQLGTTSGQYSLPQFSVLNTYVNLCATAAGDTANNSFAATYGALDRTTFFNTIYTQIFGTAPAASTTDQFVTAPAVADPAISAFQDDVNYAGSEIGGYGAVTGVLLWVAETSNLGAYPAAVNAFLTTAANSTAAGSDTAPYGSSLLNPGSVPQSVAPTVIAAAQGNTTLVGTGGADAFTFTDGTVSTALIQGFDPARDFIDLAGGFTANAPAAALASATATPAGTQLALSDGSRITFTGIAPASLTAANFLLT